MDARTTGGRIRQAREGAGFLVAKKFAEKLDIHPTLLSRYENDHRTCPIDVLSKIALLTGTTLDDLWVAHDPSVDPATPTAECA